VRLHRAGNVLDGCLGSGGGAAAGDRDSGAVDEAGVVAGEVGDGGGDLLGLGDAAGGASAANRCGMSP
jgi:hypothetical protein